MKHLCQVNSQALLQCLALFALGCLLAGCNLNLSIPGSTASANSQCQSNCALGNGARGVRVIVEPEAGPAPLVDAIRGAQKSVDLEMYLMSNNFPYLTQRVYHRRSTSGRLYQG